MATGGRKTEIDCRDQQLNNNNIYRRMKYMISANLINNLKDSKRRNRDIVKIYKKEIRKNDISQKEKKICKVCVYYLKAKIKIQII